jgi:hypothetical protein
MKVCIPWLGVESFGFIAVLACATIGEIKFVVLSLRIFTSHPVKVVTDGCFRALLAALLANWPFKV